MLSLRQYRTWVFDCDGVLLNSNQVKTEAFYRVAEPYGTDKAQALVEYHVTHGGISRYVKFQRFLTQVVGRDQVDDEELQGLLAGYAGLVRQGLLECDVAAGIHELRTLTKGAPWLVVSGGDQQELRWVFAERKLADLFDGGIYGSPETKDEILQSLTDSGQIRSPAVFVGDSQYDIEAATRAGLDFIFVRDWSESAFDFSNANYQFSSLAAIVSAFADDSLT